MVPKLFRSCIGTYSESCSCTRGANICIFAFVLGAFLSLTWKFSNTSKNYITLLKRKVSTLFFVDSLIHISYVQFRLYIKILLQTAPFWFALVKGILIRLHIRFKHNERLYVLKQKESHCSVTYTVLTKSGIYVRTTYKSLTLSYCAGKQNISTLALCWDDNLHAHLHVNYYLSTLTIFII